MGFSFSAFFFFVLITRTAHLDYNSGFFLSADVQWASCLARSLTHSLADVSSSPPLTVNLAVSAVIGVLGGVTLVTSWWRFGSVMACVVVLGLVLGFMVAATVLFTPLGRWRTSRPPASKHARTHNVCVFCGDPLSGDLSVLRHSDLLYWVTFCSIMVMVPLFFVRWPREVRPPTTSETCWSLFLILIQS